MNDFLTLGLSPKKAVGRCPHCKEFIDLLVLKCRFCHTIIRRKDTLKAIALQERINRRVGTENDERALEESKPAAPFRTGPSGASNFFHRWRAS